VNIIVIAVLISIASMIISYAMMRGFRWAYQDGGWLFLAKSFAIRTAALALFFFAITAIVGLFR